MTKVACIGECMIELKQAQGTQASLFSRGYGGDTLNTAVYLARLGAGTDYITALGDDSLSDEMIAGWAAEGVGTTRVARLPGKLPGLYMIQTDDKGERRFFHWRDSAAARSLMDLPQTPEILGSLATYEMIYLSAITLSLYGEEGRARLFAALKRAREAGARLAFDTNFRARGWPDLDVARAVYHDAFELADIVLASTEDLLPLYPGESNEALLAQIPGNEVVLKLSEPASILRLAGVSHQIRAEPLKAPVVDTTAAGDSFAAAYVAARLAGADPKEAARAGHRLAGVVVCHAGAIIPRAAMPPGLIPTTSGKASP
ncbi:sugar kinase [Bradyrhizobium valentinum]|uniref:2-dehydro-3-deoxygluconokinase n=1 Tax=Bradyrhizobium valentinum TaxID=1518501 RepID=A0A0R3KDZ5_9BRAD|nr:sugar kinase [Bradyrhizobium valentinum]KRQ93338.1 ketodeoxygluconokinase [Bradyrhizobium valentinum]KRR08709.1 ketodeoxygluconokinase [Bradyrhizobium valentinum]